MRNWVLLTGASEGIGRELALCLGARGDFNLAIAGRNVARLEELKSELSSRGIEVRILAGDLGETQFLEHIHDQLKDVFVEIVINNAGFGSHGPFSDLDLKQELAMVRVNTEALMWLTHRFLGPMRNQGRGRIMNIASTAAFQPGPFMATYYATKAFVFSFSEALREELRGTGITVTTLCPGLTRTRFIERAGMNRMMSGLRVMTAQQVAEAGCRGMFRGKPVVIPGFQNWLLAVISRRMPVWLTSRAVRKINGF